MLHVIVGLIVWFAWWVLIVFVVWLIWIDCWVCFWFVVCLDGWCCYFDYLLLLCVFDCFWTGFVVVALIWLNICNSLVICGVFCVLIWLRLLLEVCGVGCFCWFLLVLICVCIGVFAFLDGVLCYELFCFEPVWLV